MKAIIVSSSVGVGCLVQSPAVLPIMRLSMGCFRVLRAGYRDRVGINALANHPDITGPCASFAFRADQNQDMAHRIAVMHNWLEREFGVTEFEERTMLSSADFYNYLRENPPVTIQ